MALKSTAQSMTRIRRFRQPDFKTPVPDVFLEDMLLHLNTSRTGNSHTPYMMRARYARDRINTRP
jgi:hypothetical protein